MPKNTLDMPWRSIEVMRPSKKKAVQILVQGLLTDGAHHKQWFIEQALTALGEDVDDIRESLRELDYDFEEGVA